MNEEFQNRINIIMKMFILNGFTTGYRGSLDGRHKRFFSLLLERETSSKKSLQNALYRISSGFAGIGKSQKFAKFT
jgi:hypothetical protein